MSVLGYERFADSSATPSFSCTVPSGTTLVLVFFGGYEAGGYTLNTITFGGTSMGSAIFAVNVGGDSANKGAVYGLASPGSGAKTLALTFGSAWDEGGIYAVVYLDGTPTTDYTRDADGKGTYTAEDMALTMDSVAGDIGVFFMVTWDTTIDVDVVSQTKLFEDSAAYNADYGAAAHKTATGVTIGMDGDTAGGYSVSLGVVVKYAAAGGLPIPPPGYEITKSMVLGMAIRSH